MRSAASKATGRKRGIAAGPWCVRKLARLPFDSEAAEHHAELCFALRAHPIGERDLIIASIAVAQGLALVTHNVREFSRVPALTVEDWIAAG